MADEAGRPSSTGAAPATPAAVLAGWLGDLVAMVHEHIAGLTDEELAFQPDPQGNSIGVTVWHFGRWLDVIGRAFAGQPPSAELWHTGGWAARTGYDPTGIGEYGLGVLTGYSWAEVIQVPALSADELLEYLGQVTDRLLQALDGMPTEVLHAPRQGWAAPAAVTHGSARCCRAASATSVRSRPSRPCGIAGSPPTSNPTRLRFPSRRPAIR